jgi:PIN domain
LLLNFSQYGLLKPFWSNEIHDEWTRNLLRNRSDLTKKQIQRTRDCMDEFFPQAVVKVEKQFVDSLYLRDRTDIHVLATAIAAKARFIVTYNLKDFPRAHLLEHGVHAIHPDVLCTALIVDNQYLALESFMNQVRRLQQPPISEEKVIEALARCQLKQTATLLMSLLG